MLLEKKESEIIESGITFMAEHCLYNSSNVIASYFDEKDRNLNVVFDNGSSYVYQNVLTTDYVWFRENPSQGKVIHNRLKDYKYTKGDPILNLDELKNKINELKTKKK